MQNEQIKINKINIILNVINIYILKKSYTIGATWALLNDNNINFWLIYSFNIVFFITMVKMIIWRSPVQSQSFTCMHLSKTLNQSVCLCNVSPKSHWTKVSAKRMRAYIEHCFTVCFLSWAIYSPRWVPVPDSACCTCCVLRGINTVFKETFRLSRDDGSLYCCHLGVCVLGSTLGPPYLEKVTMYHKSH